MIINSLFPTAQTQDVGRTQGQFQCKRTDLCNSVDVDMSTFASAYYLGWANPNNLPKAFWLSHCYETETEYVFECIEPSANFMIGFCTLTESVTHAGYRQYTGQTAETAVLNNTRLINDLYPEFVGATATNYDIILFFIGFFSEPGSLHVNQFNSSISNVVSGSEKINNYNQWLRYKNGEFKLKFNAPGQYGTYEIGFSDISSTGRIITTTSTGVNVTLYYKGFSLNSNRRYNGSASSGWNILPFIVQQGSFKDTDVTGGKEFRAVRGSYYNNWAAYYQPLTGNTPGVLHPTGYDSFGVGYDNCVIKKEDIPMGGMNIFDYVDYTTMLLVRTSAYNYQFFPVGDINDIDAFFGLLPRLIRIPSSSDVPSYQDGLTYAPDVSANNEFLCQIKSGNISDENFKAGLRPWQYVDWEEYEEDPTKPQGIQKDEFIETEAPPYDPTPPTPPGEEGTNPDNPDAGLGQVDDTPADQIEEDRMNDNRIVFGANAFITQYVLTLSQLISLGQYLWSNITDPNSNGLKNFVAIFSDTGTFNSANCLQCFVSLKVFPFDMFNTVYSNAAPDLRAGSGYTALLAESVTIFSSCTYSIDCGTVDVTADGYNIVAGQYDFRNYVNTTVCVFLPFCGTVELNPADVFGFTLSCTYYIDVSSGTCTACVFVDRGDNKRLMVASKSGQIGFNIPMSATNAMQVAGTFLSDAASAAQTISDTVLSLATSKALGSIGAPVEDAAASQQYLQGNVRATSSAVGKATSGIAGAISGLGNMMSRSGCAYPSLSGGTGMAALFFDKTPYVVIRRSNYSSPNNYAHTTGFATTDGGTEHKSTLGAYAGWTVVKNCDLKNIHANREELDEIKHLLETGIYL